MRYYKKPKAATSSGFSNFGKSIKFNHVVTLLCLGVGVFIIFRLKNFSIPSLFSSLLGIDTKHQNSDVSQRAINNTTAKITPISDTQSNVIHGLLNVKQTNLGVHQKVLNASNSSAVLMELIKYGKSSLMPLFKSYGFRTVSFRTNWTFGENTDGNLVDHLGRHLSEPYREFALYLYDVARGAKTANTLKAQAKLLDNFLYSGKAYFQNLVESWLNK